MSMAAQIELQLQSPYEHAGPFLKWAGSKRQLASTILAVIERMHPGQIEVYQEPFVGAGSVFFALARARKFKHAILSDTNAELMDTYRVVRDYPAPLMRELDRLAKRGFSEKTYYLVRASEPDTTIERAARMVYLNKTGFNGLYRVNKKGQFNVPWGKRKSPALYDYSALMGASAALEGVDLFERPYDQALAYALRARDTFTYFDPPYVPVSESSDFTAYGKDGFGADDQEYLASLFRMLASHNLLALLSNSHCKTTLKLYQGLVRKRVLASRNINSKGDKRGNVSELLVESRLRVTRKRTK